MPERLSRISKEEQLPLFTRRQALKIGGAGLLALLSAAYLASQDQSSTPVQPVPTPELNGFLIPEVINSELARFNRMLHAEPGRAKEIAPALGTLAIRYFCQEMNSTLGGNHYNPDSYAGRVFYEWNNEYRRKVLEESGCTVVSNPPDNEFSYFNQESNTIHINLDKILYMDLRSKKPTETPAHLLFASLIHEDHHAGAELVELDNPEFFSDAAAGTSYIGIRKHGLLTVALDPGYSKPGINCYRTYRVQLEETVVQHSTDLMTQKLGFKMSTGPVYSAWVDNYSRKVI